MLTKKLKKHFKENKDTYFTVGLIMGVGFFAGASYQYKKDLAALTKNIRAGKALIPNMGDAMVPALKAVKTIDELKQAALITPNTTVKDALVVTVEGLPYLFVR